MGQPRPNKLLSPSPALSSVSRVFQLAFGAPRMRVNSVRTRKETEFKTTLSRVFEKRITLFSRLFGQREKSTVAKSRSNRKAMASSGNLGCVIVAVDGSEESMDSLRWALDNLKLRSPAPNSTEAPSSFVVLHVQSPPSIAAGLSPAAIPFVGPS